jgi:hypothetical protein
MAQPPKGPGRTRELERAPLQSPHSCRFDHFRRGARAHEGDVRKLVRADQAAPGGVGRIGKQVGRASSSDSELSLIFLDNYTSLEYYAFKQTPEGLWGAEADVHAPLPLLLPQNAPSNNQGLSFAQDFWMHEGYFQPTFKVREEGRVGFLEGWLHNALTGGSGWHAQSETYVGGPRGVVWIARAIVKLVANLGASTGVYDKPYPAPEGYDFRRVSAHDHSRALESWDEWNVALKRSNKVLEESAHERQQPPGDDRLDHIDQNDRHNSLDDEEINVETTAHDKPTRSLPHRAKKSKPTAGIPDSEDSDPSSDRCLPEKTNHNESSDASDNEDAHFPSTSAAKGLFDLFSHSYTITVR